MQVAGTLRKRNETSATGPLGHVQSVSGSRVSIGLVRTGTNGLHGAGLTVGKFVKIKIARAVLVGVITDVSAERIGCAAGSFSGGALGALLFRVHRSEHAQAAESLRAGSVGPARSRWSSGSANASERLPLRLRLERRELGLAAECHHRHLAHAIFGDKHPQIAVALVD